MTVELLDDSIDGYGFVKVNAQVTESLTMDSGGVITLTFDWINHTIGVHSLFEFYLNLTLTDDDSAPGYGADQSRTGIMRRRLSRLAALVALLSIKFQPG